MKKEVSAARFDQIRKEMARSESVHRRIPVGSLEINEDSLKNNVITLGGNRVPVAKSFWSRLGGMLKINQSLVNQMLRNGDYKLAGTLMNGLKDYAAKNKTGHEVILIANTTDMKIMDICDPKRYRRVSNDTILDVTERILNENPSLIVETVDYNSSNGTAQINLLNNQEVGFAKAGPDEFFKFGFSIVQTTKDTIVETYNQRLVCTNGMRASLGAGAIGGRSDKAMTFEDKFRLGGNKPEDIKIFLQRIDAMKKAEFVPTGFDQAIQRAVDTKASLHEIEAAYGLAVSKIDEPDLDLKKGYQELMKRNYFHAMGDTYARITRKGKDPYKLLDQQKKFIKTGMSVWDVVNSMTFLGSNNSGIPLVNQPDLKKKAGDYFAKAKKEGYDLEFAQFAAL